MICSAFENSFNSISEQFADFLSLSIAGELFIMPWIAGYNLRKFKGPPSLSGPCRFIILCTLSHRVNAVVFAVDYDTAQIVHLDLFPRAGSSFGREFG